MTYDLCKHVFADLFWNAGFDVFSRQTKLETNDKSATLFQQCFGGQCRFYYLKWISRKNSITMRKVVGHLCLWIIYSHIFLFQTLRQKLLPLLSVLWFWWEEWSYVIWFVVSFSETPHLESLLVQGNSTESYQTMGKRSRSADGSNGSDDSDDSDSSPESESESESSSTPGVVTSNSVASSRKDPEVAEDRAEPAPTSSSTAPVSEAPIQGGGGGDMSDDDGESVPGLPYGPSTLSDLFDWANLYAEKLLSGCDDPCMRRFLKICEKSFVHQDAYSGLGTAALSCKIQLDALLRRVNRCPGFRFGNNKQPPFSTIAEPATFCLFFDGLCCVWVCKSEMYCIIV